MRLSVSHVNGCADKVTTFLKQALPFVEVKFDGATKDGYDIVGVLEVSEFDDFKKLPEIVERAGRNIVQAAGGGNRVLCHVDTAPEIKWVNNLNDSW